MKRIVQGLVAALLAAAAPAAVQAQNLVVTNARIIVGNGQVIERGTIVVRDGKIASVGAGNAAAPAGAQRVDGTGFTVVPGYIDAHRHLIQAGNPPDMNKWFAETAPVRMRELLESGVTTVLSGGDNNEGIVELKKRVDSGTIKGPRIVTAGRIQLANRSEQEVRAAVQAAARAGADTIAEIIFPQRSQPYAPSDAEQANLRAAIDEGRRLNVPVQVHAVSPQAMVGAVRLGAKKLVHTPHFGWVTNEQAREVAAAGAQVSSCTGFGAPVFGVFNQENRPTFRDGNPWPQGILDGEGRGQEAGYKPVNGRTLFDNGVTYGYCTDTTYNATAALAHELRVLSLMFSPIDLVKVMGPNSAAFLDRTDIGTLEAGKRGDLVVLTGNPLDGYWNFLTAVVVAKDGVVMVDKRPQLRNVRALPAR